MKRETSGRARYEEIAFDLAQRIVAGELAEGQRLLGRSSLSGTYQVSPETIRRAVAILHERAIVQAMAGSGIRVLSRFAAMDYLESLRTRSSLEQSVHQLRALIKQRQKIDEQIQAAQDRILNQVTSTLASRHVEEVPIKADTWVVGRSLYEIRLRSRTDATAVAISREEDDYFSPPIDLVLQPGDVLTIIGTEAARARARELLAATTPPPTL